MTGRASDLYYIKEVLNSGVNKTNANTKKQEPETDWLSFETIKVENSRLRIMHRQQWYFRTFSDRRRYNNRLSIGQTRFLMIIR